MKHLFLTGDKQVGKSTLLRVLIDTLSLCCSGFETKPYLIDGERRGFMLHGRVDMPPFENDCIMSVRIAQQMSVPVLPTFDQNGVKILRLSIESSSPFLLMDELGKLESEAALFEAAVLACLDDDKRVLGVLQRGDYPLKEKIAARCDTQIIHVTLDNRDELKAALIQQLRQSI